VCSVFWGSLFLKKVCVCEWSVCFLEGKIVCGFFGVSQGDDLVCVYMGCMVHGIPGSDHRGLGVLSAMMLFFGTTVCCVFLWGVYLR